MSEAGFPWGPHAEVVLRRRYLARDRKGRVCETPEEMLRRVAEAAARAEEAWGGGRARRRAARDFFELTASGLFLPNSPTLMNAGRRLGQLAACFVLPVEDDLASIFQAVQYMALIHKSGGGVGLSFSRLRPAGDMVASTGGASSGPVSFMTVFDAAAEAVKQGGARRGANMGVLSASHPDIELFIQAKREPGRLANFNISVMAGDDFMARAASGGGWELINPRTGRAARRVEAGALLELLISEAHAAGEPGLIFYDAVNRANPTPALGPMEAVNPCGEQPLLPHESCNLGSLALPRFLRGGRVDYPALEEAAALAVRFLDDILEINRFPLPQTARASRLTRKVGLGVMGFADLLSALEIPYASPRAADLGREIMARIQAAARQASADLGRRRGSFPAFPASRHRRRGWTHMRNATVTTVAPTGTLSLLMGCSSGIEPHFAMAFTRRVLDGRELAEINPLFLARLKSLGLADAPNLEALAASGRASAVEGLPRRDAEIFASAHEISPEAHLAVQAAFQEHTDNAVSKTVNLPAEAGVDAVRRVFLEAHRLGLKGVTVFRHGCRGPQVLELAPTAVPDRCPSCGASGRE